MNNQHHESALPRRAVLARLGASAAVLIASPLIAQTATREDKEIPMNAFNKSIDFNSNVAPARTADVSGLLEDDDRIAWVRRVRIKGWRYVHNHGDPLDMNGYGFRNDDTHGDDTEAFIDAMKRRILFGAPENWG